MSSFLKRLKVGLSIWTPTAVRITVVALPWFGLINLTWALALTTLYTIGRVDMLLFKILVKSFIIKHKLMCENGRYLIASENWFLKWIWVMQEFQGTKLYGTTFGITTSPPASRDSPNLPYKFSPNDISPLLRTYLALPPISHEHDKRYGPYYTKNTPESASTHNSHNW